MARKVTNRTLHISIHVEKAIALAREKAGWAGRPSCRKLWGLSKRELVEVALRLGALNSGYCDSVSAGRKAVLDELDALRENKVI